MGLFGGSSKSNTSTNEQLALTVDNRIIEPGSVAGGNVTISNSQGGAYNVTTTDFGALDMAGDLSERAFSQVQNSIDAVRTVASDSTATIAQALNKVTDFATKQTGTDQNQTVQYLIMGAALVLAIWVYRS